MKPTSHDSQGSLATCDRLYRLHCISRSINVSFQSHTRTVVIGGQAREASTPIVVGSEAQCIARIVERNLDAVSSKRAQCYFDRKRWRSRAILVFVRSRALITNFRPGFSEFNRIEYAAGREKTLTASRCNILWTVFFFVRARKFEYSGSRPTPWLRKARSCRPKIRSIPPTSLTRSCLRDSLSGSMSCNKRNVRYPLHINHLVTCSQRNFKVPSGTLEIQV
jgi:hypothetical protein